ncbi:MULTISPECIES: hypothetical protein [unclassified Coleofasciculus]|uniref:hypothetical protein n=1 Tax=unclassified Coleofasciculus TaxID=2692782 RepID=UPI0018813B9F|nr:MULTISPECIES: hypothetical protein [unclassified Coleofasciculus]MBE9127960.1 hypothetical protein [Coleofasciculus sp. LEGE 07081]MBE9149861.1 hypothetical protein [Coleofasciculus sp. LEGE 07092]
MNRDRKINKKNIGLVGAIFGGFLMGLSTIPKPASAAPLAPLVGVNPCPGIYYDEPFSRMVMAPVGCPPNAATQMGQGGQISNSPITPAPPPAGIPQPPLPENRSDAVATIMPMDNTVDVRLKNNTNAIVSFEAVGHTERRYLQGGEETVLQNLPLPTTITAVRQDEGLLQMMPMSADEEGLLEVSLEEETRLDDNQGVLRIQPDGQVFVN